MSRRARRGPPSPLVQLVPLLASLLLLPPLAPRSSAAQGAAPAAATPSVFRPLARLDVLAARQTALHAGAGATAPLGNYVRLDLLAAGGVVLGGGDGGARASGRVEGIGRFLFDPFFQFRWAPYVGAGISGRFDAGDPGRALLVTVVGVEGPPRGGWLPAAEVGIGGGVRVGAALRRRRPDRR